MMSAPEPIRRARLLRPLIQLSLLVLITLALVWSVELIRRQDPFLRAAANIPAELEQLELLLEQPTLTLRDGARVLATLHLDALAIERNRVHWRAKHLRQAILYDARGEPIGTARADELTYNFPAKRLYIAGNPTLTIRRHPLGDFPLTVQTAWLNWDLRQQQIHTDLPTRLTWQDGQGAIERLRWDLASGVLTLERGRFRVSSALVQERAQPKREIDIQWDTAKLRSDHSEVQGLRLRDGDTLATAERADVYDRKRYALATGNLRLEDPRIDIEGKQLEIWYGENQKRARLQNSVRMRIKPRETQPPPAGEEESEVEQAKRYPIDATCDDLEYFYRRKVAYLRGNIKAVQQLPEGRTRTLYADEAEYDQNKETLTLKGKVILDEPDRLRLETELAIVSLKEGEETVELPRGAKGVFYYTEEDEEATPPNGNR
jgi:lipopolysaccharide export system protein LptA